MRNDRDKELARIEKELLADDDLLADLPESLLDDGREEASPAFEDPEQIYEPEEPLVYCNFSNDYGRELTEEIYADQEESTAEKKRGDKILIGLVAVVGLLCLVILGVIVYGLKVFLK